MTVEMDKRNKQVRTVSSISPSEVTKMVNELMEKDMRWRLVSITVAPSQTTDHYLDFWYRAWLEFDPSS